MPQMTENQKSRQTVCVCPICKGCGRILIDSGWGTRYAGCVPCSSSGIIIIWR